MRFESRIAFKYLIPRWRQLSVSIISLISVLVISLVVWLVILFLSIKENMEHHWVRQLVALAAPLRMTPSEAYYHSYYHQIDGVSSDANYTVKTIGEKRAALQTHPYDPSVDRELPPSFPAPDLNSDGSLRDLVKESWALLEKLPHVRPQEYEASVATLHLPLPAREDQEGHVFTQVSYLVSHDAENEEMKKMLLPPTTEDWDNLLQRVTAYALSTPTPLPGEKRAPLPQLLADFFRQVRVTRLETSEEGFLLTPALFPEKGRWRGIGLVMQNEVRKVVIPRVAQECDSLEGVLQEEGYRTLPVELLFDQEQMHVVGPHAVSPRVQLYLEGGIPFEAELVANSFEKATSLSSLRFTLLGSVQGERVAGTAAYKHLHIADAEGISTPSSPPWWVHYDSRGAIVIPHDQPFGEGILVASTLQGTGVRLGDRGYLSYYTQTGGSPQEQRISVYVAGFYNPGMTPLGRKLIFVDPQISLLLRTPFASADPLLGNGINLWLKNPFQAPKVKEEIIRALKEQDLDKYWTVESYQDYDFVRPILAQIQGEQRLFSIIALLILLVAGSNIISMLILLVNDKKREIGILQAMGASPARIALIFGLCGFLLGGVSCVIGTLAALFTLKHLEGFLHLLSLVQRGPLFQPALFGEMVLDQVNHEVLWFIILATLGISLLAGTIPAFKATRLRPAEILRAE